MPVTVSLLELVRVADSRDLWPPEFRTLVDQLEADPADKTLWGVLADWCDEEAVAEPLLAEAFRWVHKRPDVAVERGKTYPREAWSFAPDGMPSAVRYEVMHETDCKTLAGLAAELAATLARLRQQMF